MEQANDNKDEVVSSITDLSDEIKGLRAKLDQLLDKPPARELTGRTGKSALVGYSINARAASVTGASSGAAARGKADARNPPIKTQAPSQKVIILLPVLLENLSCKR